MSSFAHRIINWYLINQRDLPWRNISDPYAIWVSEIILQQTRVAQGLSYYHRFLQHFPTVRHLADASLDSVLRVWQGLGYYTRARNMHLAARQVMSEFNGEFPDNYKDLRLLRGVGDYTASAIGAFAFGIARPAVDGNAYRIIARIFGIATPIDTGKGQKEIYAMAQDLLDKQRPALFNQAMMDFGATLCTPQNPQCSQCPFADSCHALQHHSIDLLPVKSKKIKIRSRYFSYLVFQHKDATFLQQRTGKDIWHSLYEFPMIETPTPCSLSELEQTKEWQQWTGSEKPTIIAVSAPIKHILTHQCLLAQFYVVNIRKISPLLKKSCLKVPFQQLGQYSMPQLLSNYLANENIGCYFS